MDQISSEEKPSSDKPPCNVRIGVGGWVVGALFVLCVLLLVGSAVWGCWDWYAYQQVESREDVGRITGASYTSSFSLHTSAIQTTTGTYVCRGFMQAVNGHRMRIEKRGNGERALCDVETSTCLRMLGK